MPSVLPWSDVREQRPRGTRNVCRTTAILKAVAVRNTNGVTLSGLARAVALPVSTVKRILEALVLEGFVAYSQATRHFHLGHEMYDLGRRSWPVRLAETFQPVLDSISRRTGDTSYLIVHSGLDGLCIGLAVGAASIRIPYGVGSRAPLGVGTSSLVLLAALDAGERERTIDHNRPAYARLGLDETRIRSQVEAARRDDWLVNRSEFIEGVVGVAVPITDDRGRVPASITVSSTAQRMDRARCREIRLLIRDRIRALAGRDDG